MLQSIFDSSTIGLLEKMAVFGERRHEVLAGNVANIDTPGYHTRDLPVAAFQQALNDAVRARQESAAAESIAVTASGAKSLAELFPRELFEATEAPARNVTFHDGNNRSIEHEVMEITKNTMMQNFAIELMNAQMNLMQAVISERP